MYNMLLGKMPDSEKPQTLHELSTNIPIVISQIVAKAMMDDPCERYQSIYGMMVNSPFCSTLISILFVVFLSLSFLFIFFLSFFFLFSYLFFFSFLSLSSLSFFFLFFFFPFLFLFHME
jgi:hypothetical protein